MASTTLCPDEDNPPPSAPGKVASEEIVVRFVAKKEHLGDSAGTLKLTPSHWSRSDLKGKGRNASVFRGCTSEEELEARAKVHNQCDEWADDPMVATALVLDIREVKDADDNRELCVNADPIEDDIGVCNTHSGIARSQVAGDTKAQRTEILTIIDRLCDIFIVARFSAKPKMR